MFKKLEDIIIILFSCTLLVGLLYALGALAAPPYNLSRTIIPEINNTYTLGNATRTWADLYASKADFLMTTSSLSITEGTYSIYGQPIYMPILEATGSFMGSPLSILKISDNVALQDSNISGDSYSYYFDSYFGLGGYYVFNYNDGSFRFNHAQDNKQASFIDFQNNKVASFYDGTNTVDILDGTYAFNGESLPSKLGVGTTIGDTSAGLNWTESTYTTGPAGDIPLLTPTAPAGTLGGIAGGLFLLNNGVVNVGVYFGSAADNFSTYDAITWDETNRTIVNSTTTKINSSSGNRDIDSPLLILADNPVGIGITASENDSGAAIKTLGRRCSNKFLTTCLGAAEFYTTGIMGRVENNGHADTSVYKGALSFYTNDSGNYLENMRLTGAGYLGIGTTSPVARLEVNGNVKVDGTTTANCFTTDGSTCIGGGSSYDQDLNTTDRVTFASVTSSGTIFASSTVTIHAPSDTYTSLKMAGWGGLGTYDTEGTAFVNSFNSTGNRQLALFDSAQIGDPTAYGFRYILGFPVPIIDAVDGTMSSVGNLIIGQGGSVGIGYGAGTTQGQLTHQLQVSTEIYAGSNILIGTDSAYGDEILSVDGDAYINGTTTATCFTTNGTDCLGVGSVGGSGTAGYVPYWSATSTLADTNIYYTSTNVGIASATPNYTLSVGGNTYVSGTITTTGDIVIGSGNDIKPTTDATDAISIKSADGSSRTVMRIDTLTSNSVGRIALGLDTAPQYQLEIINQRTAAAGATDRGLTISQHVSAIAAAQMNWKRSRGTYATPTVVAAGDAVGNIWGLAYDGDQYLGGVAYYAQLITSAADNNVQVAQIWGANPAGAASLTGEKMRLTYDGKLGIGTTSPSELFSVAGNAYITGTLSVIATTTLTSDLVANKSIYLPTTATSTGTGIIYMNSIPYIWSPHNVNQLFIGYNAGSSTYSGTNYGNVGIGKDSLSNLTTGYYNMALGNASMQDMTTGYQNTAIGFNALTNQTTGDLNVAIGASSLQTSNDVNYNTAIGALTLNDTNFDGDDNITIGYASGYKMTTADKNVSIGRSGMYNLTTGDNNTGIGYSACNGLTTGSNNICLGWNAGTSNTNNITGSIVIGGGVNSTLSNVGILGTTSVAFKWGIGTTTPAAKLTVLSPVSTEDLLVIGTTTETDIVYVNSAGNIYLGGYTSGNYTQIETDGTIYFAGNATVWDDIRVPLSTAKAAGIKDPGFDQFSATSTSRVWAFDGGTTEEELFFTAQVPHGYKLGTTLFPHVHLSPSDTATGTIVFKLECDWSDDEGVFASTSVEYATTTIATDSSHKNIFTYFSTTTPIYFADVSGIINCRISRTPTGGDTYPSDVFVHETDWHYEADTIGSRTETTK